MSREEDVNNWIIKANELQRKKEMAVAEQLYERALRVQPSNQNALIGLGTLYVSTGRGPMALKKMQRAQRDNPSHSGPYRAIATLIRMSGHLSVGEHYFKGVITSVPPEALPYVRLSLAEIYAAQGNTENLKAELQALSALEPVEPMTQALLLMETSDSQGLVALSGRVNGESLCSTLHGMAAEASGDLSGASQHYFTASNAEAPTWICLNALAAMWLNSGNLNACVAYLNHAEDLAPNASEIQLTRARYLSAKGEWEQAKALIKQVGDMAGNFARVRELARTLLRQV